MHVEDTEGSGESGLAPRSKGLERSFPDGHFVALIKMQVNEGWEGSGSHSEAAVSPLVPDIREMAHP